MAFPARATALPRIQESDASLTLSCASHAGTQSDSSDVLGLSQLRRSAEGFHCNGVASLAVAGPTFQWLARQTISVGLAVFRARFLITGLSANMHARTSRRPRTAARYLCRARLVAATMQRRGFFIAAAWLCLLSQSGSLNSYPLRRMAAHETRAELFRGRLPAGIARGAYDPSGRCLRHSLLPRRRDPSVLNSTGDDIPGCATGQ